MGWDSCNAWTKKSDVVNDLKSQFARSEWKVHAEKSFTGGAWFVVENTSGAKFIYLALIKKYSGEFAVKTMTEHMGPSETSCPLSFLSIADVPAESEKYAIEWRERVKQSHLDVIAAKGRQKRELTIDKEIILYGKTYKVMQTGDKTLVRSADGKVYKLTKKQLGHWIDVDTVS